MKKFITLFYGIIVTWLISTNAFALDLVSRTKLDNLAENLFWFVPVASLIALITAFIFYKKMMGEDEGDPLMIKIAKHVREGANAYLRQQYKVVSIFFVVAFLFFLFLAFVLHVQAKLVPFAFITGGFFSGLCGFLGMKTATYASSRTAQAAKKSLNKGLQIAFHSGAVMGLVVVGFGLFDIALWYFLLKNVFHIESLFEITTTMLCFGMGASSQALFARTGGGIFTKAADVGADLVGKVEAGIPEDDPRNPATIADNVGDNVGDIAGMGADLYESYCGSILAAAALGVAAGLSVRGLVLPMIISAAGIIFSIVGILFVRTKEDAEQKDLIKALGRGVNLSSILIVITSYFAVKTLLPDNFGIFWSIISGLVAGIIIGKITEYYTSESYSPTKKVAENTKTGVATVIISGFALGMESTFGAVLTISVGIFCSFMFANGFVNPALGLYGIGIAAVGMLSTLGITLATDCYGPIADNAGGNAQMAKLDPIVRKRTDALDSLGNTTAATGKGFAIGSAALTALALLAAYIEEVRIGLQRIGVSVINVGGRTVDVATATINDFVVYYNIHLMNPKVIIGVFIGAMLTFLFCSMTMKSVGRAAGKIVDEVRRQFREIKGLMTGEADADYKRCVEICTKAAQHEMILPSLVAIFTPLLTGLILGVEGVMGLLLGGMTTGFVLAVMMANSGGAWDNAKKYIESGAYGGKGSDNHKAAVVGDTVGDPFKDTSGPSLNILIKLMSMVSVIFAGLVVKYSPIISHWLGIQ